MTIPDLALLGAGAAMLVLGAFLLVEGGSGLARRLGVSPLWIGLAVVSIGTSAPEVVVSTMAVVQGRPDVALGNVLGSNVLNVLIVLGLTALLVPVPVSRAMVRRDMLLLVGAGVTVWLLAADGGLSRIEAGLMLAAFVSYLVHAYKGEAKGVLPVQATPAMGRRWPWPAQVAAVLGGLALLLVGGDAVVEAAVFLARSWGVDDRTVAVTVVAIGTSLPELSTSLVAAFRKEVDLAIGNVVGSNLANLLLVLGLSGVVHPVAVSGSILRIDFTAAVAVSLLMFRFATTRGHISRWEGATLIAAYVAYAALLLSGWSG